MPWSQTGGQATWNLCNNYMLLRQFGSNFTTKLILQNTILNLAYNCSFELMVANWLIFLFKQSYTRMIRLIFMSTSRFLTDSLLCIIPVEDSITASNVFIYSMHSFDSFTDSPTSELFMSQLNCLKLYPVTSYVILIVICFITQHLFFFFFNDQ